MMKIVSHLGMILRKEGNRMQKEGTKFDKMRGKVMADMLME